MSSEQRWQTIQHQTQLLIERAADAEASELNELVTQRQQELELFFSELDYNEISLQEVEQRIQHLLDCDRRLADSCRQQQQLLLQESEKHRHSQRSVAAYENQPY